MAKASSTVDGPRAVPGVSSRASVTRTNRSPTGYATLTIRCGKDSDADVASGMTRNTQASSTRPTMRTSASIMLRASRPVDRDRMNSASPATYSGYAARKMTSANEGNGSGAWVTVA